MNLAKFQRLAHKVYKKNIPLLPTLIYYIQFFLFNSSIPPAVKIGKGSKFAYGGIGCVINKKATIGQNCMIGQGITIGGRGKKSPGRAVIEDYVYIGAGARILGSVKLGEYSIIAPNAVVIKDVEPFSVVGGIPAKVLRANLTKEEYFDMV